MSILPQVAKTTPLLSVISSVRGCARKREELSTLLAMRREAVEGRGRLHSGLGPGGRQLQGRMQLDFTRKGNGKLHNVYLMREGYLSHGPSFFQNFNS